MNLVEITEFDHWRTYQCEMCEKLFKAWRDESVRYCPYCGFDGKAAAEEEIKSDFLKRMDDMCNRVARFEMWHKLEEERVRATIKKRYENDI